MKDKVHIYNICTLLSSFGQKYIVKKYLISYRFGFFGSTIFQVFFTILYKLFYIIWFKNNG